MSIFIFLWIVSILATIAVAAKNERNPFIAFVWSFFFGWLAFIGYLFAGKSWERKLKESAAMENGLPLPSFEERMKAKREENLATLETEIEKNKVKKAAKKAAKKVPVVEETEAPAPVVKKARKPRAKKAVA